MVLLIQVPIKQVVITVLNNHIDVREEFRGTHGTDECTGIVFSIETFMENVLITTLGHPNNFRT